MLLLSSADFFSELTLSTNFFRSRIGMSYGLHPDPDRRSVSHGLGPNCKGYQQMTNVATSKEKLNMHT